ncbi:MAG TPA: DUF3422 domain-containing protein [Noviherbaspirillum sp.]
MNYSSLNHSLRVPLAAEVHSRPFLRLDAPEALTHLAVYTPGAARTGQADAAEQHALLAALCMHFGVAAPGVNAKYFFHDFGRFRLKWEAHTEFATYTFAERRTEALPLEEAFVRVPLRHIPKDWLGRLAGRVMVAAHVLLDQSQENSHSYAARVREVMEGNVLVGSHVLQGGEVWTDFLIQSDGFTRFIVRDVALREQQAGRLVQRVLEIETYRMMALLGLPHAQQASPALNAIESELGSVTTAMVDSLDGAREPSLDTDREQALLETITGLAAQVEKLASDNSYRFAASQAYYRLINARTEELRETRIEGFQTVGEFMERRLMPAMNTCEAVARRQVALAERIAHSNALLRTRVGILQEHQNRQILQSLNARAAQQLRLQQAVEGLSVVAISYYLVGLVSYAGKAAKAAGLPVNPDMLAGLLVPLLAFGVWAGLRSLRKKIHSEST